MFAGLSTSELMEVVRAQESGMATMDAIIEARANVTSSLVNVDRAQEGGMVEARANSDSEGEAEVLDVAGSFTAAKKFSGAREGYKFCTGPSGLGYYKK
jgi:hypothetical protein